MNGVMLLGLRAKESSDSCDLGAFTESERVVGSWSRLECCIARTVRYAAFEERRAAAVHADVGRCTELRFSRFQCFSVGQGTKSKKFAYCTGNT